MTSHLYYLGPAGTFSHEAAQAAAGHFPFLDGVNTVACATGDEMFARLYDEPADDAAVIVPVYNLVQGPVHDFARFYLFTQRGEWKHRVRLHLFGRPPKLADVQRLYTKDTVVPQVSRWLDAAPAHIKIIAHQNLSTAGAARRAAADPHGAAVCSAAAGQSLGLNHLAANIADRADNYTQFGIFTRAHHQHRPDGFPADEYPFNLSSDRLARLQNGHGRILWEWLDPDPRLHAGHAAVLGTLQRLGTWGNRLLIHTPAARADRLRPYLADTDYELLPLTEPSPPPHTNAADMTAVLQQPFLAGRMHSGKPVRLAELLAPVRFWQRVAMWDVDAAVGGVGRIHAWRFVVGQRPDFGGVLVRYTAGTDGYAKMDWARGNAQAA